MESLLTIGIMDQVREICKEIMLLPEVDQVEAINEIKRALHEVSPMREEPVDCVLWVDADSVEANDYNPNKVAPPEMRLLAHSIESDGYTQPIVTWRTNGHHEVIDGFHRNRVGKENKAVRKRIKGLLPVVSINSGREDMNDRVAATIRHNRARGKHQVNAMSEIVVDLKRRNWSDERIGKELGMDADEVLRLSQISGLAEMFADREFSEAWEITNHTTTRGGHAPPATAARQREGMKMLIKIALETPKTSLLFSCPGSGDARIKERLAAGESIKSIAASHPHAHLVPDQHRRNRARLYCYGFYLGEPIEFDWTPFTAGQPMPDGYEWAT